MNPNKIVIYSVLPRLWGNKTKNLKVGGTLSENGSGKLSDFTPEALAYIRSLGATHICTSAYWSMPPRLTTAPTASSPITPTR